MPSPCAGAAFVLRSAPFHARFHQGFA
jgi:hypothetical protein